MASAAAAISPSGTHSRQTSAPAPSAPRGSGPRTVSPAALRAPGSAGPSRTSPTIAIVVCISRSSPRPGCRSRCAVSKCSGSCRRAGVYHRPVPPTKDERREALKAVFHEARACQNCPQLAATRTTVVFGNGNADADLMFVGEAPGANEDRQGLPFVGQAGKLLDTLLGEIGLVRGDVFVANVLKCLSYRAMVQLGDGSWERIGRLVRNRYEGTVMSVDERGHLVPRRVTGWHATPLGERSVHRLTYRSSKNVGANRSSVDLTGDHPVLTERGYVRVDELRPGDRVATGQGLSALARDVVCGTLLGDGSINARAAHLTLAHSERQAAYAEFKAQLITELRPSRRTLEVTAVAGSDRTYGVVHVRTSAHRALGVLRRDFYRPKKVVPNWIADRLNARMLAFWFMDDGYTRIRPGGRRPVAEIATVAFSDSDLQVLLEGLRRLGLPAKASRRRIYFDVPATRRLSELIAPYVPPVMRYKLNPEIVSQVPFDPSRLEPGPPEVMYDEVEVEEITHHPRPDRTFFCIDVEETHNFVTAGAVVHNCRPPGNRDPHPGGDRGVPVVPAAPGRAHRAARDLHARELRDEAAARRPDRHHAAARPRRGSDDRSARGALVSAVPSGRRALHARERRGAAGRLRSDPRAARDGPAAAAGAGRRGGRAGRRRRGAGPARGARAGGRARGRRARARARRGRAAARGAARPVLMPRGVHDAAALGFARSADAYDRARPDYPEAAIAWLADRMGLRAGRTVVDLAAGTGKLTPPLAGTGAGGT